MDANRYIQHPASSSTTPSRRSNAIAENIAADLEGFSRHAGRSTVNTDDVLLITRRNDALHGIMKDVVDKELVKKGKQKARRQPVAKK
jgi:hypothetical protein